MWHCQALVTLLRVPSDSDFIICWILAGVVDGLTWSNALSNPVLDRFGIAGKTIALNADDKEKEVTFEANEVCVPPFVDVAQAHKLW